MRAHALTGRFVHGTGGSGVFVDGQRIQQTAAGEAGYGCWLGNRVLYQFRDTTLWSCLADGSDARQEQAQGAAWLAAGGDLWIAHQPPRGVLTSWGHFIPGAGALGVAKDGSAVFVIGDFVGDRAIARYRPGATAPDLVLGDVRGPLLLTPYAQFDALDADRFMWRTIDGVLHTHGLPEPVSQPWPSYQPSLIDAGDQGIWVVDGDGDDRLRARPLDSLTGYIVREQGVADQARGFSICGRRDGGTLQLGWSTTTGEDAASFRTVAIDLAAPRVVLGATPIPVLPIPPSPAQPFGPLSAPLHEGTPIDVAAYVIGAPGTWPRTGTHPMHQVIDGDRVHFVKFGDRNAYETWSLDADWVHHLEDASNPETQVFTDTRWLARVMKVGEAHAFSTGEHEAIWMRRAGCQEIRRGPFTRRMWVVDAWARFWCGPDLGERAVVCVAYDSTGGFHADDRGVELYYFAAGAGWIRWEYHASSRVFAGDTPRFDDTTRTARSDFYRVGGAAVAPALTTCAIAPSTHPETIPMKLPATVMTIVRAYAGVFPVPQGDGPDSVNTECRAWVLGLNQTLKARFPNGLPGVGGEFGHKRADPHRDPSKETVAVQVRDARGAQVALHGWDMLDGVGTGRPKLNTEPGYHDLMYAEGINGPIGASQVFIPVEAIDRLKGATSAQTHVPLAATLWGMSAFDLMCRIAEGDMRYLDQVIVPSGLVPRIVVASVWQGGVNNRTRRTPAEGRAQMPATFAALKARGRQAEFTLLCDTKEFGLSRADALAHIAVCNGLLLSAPDCVAGVRIGNENSHSVEQPYMTDPVFLREAKALIDPRFPVSLGAGHGGEGVLAGGSYASHHSDRSLTPSENGAIMAAAQEAFGIKVVDGEPKGITETNRVAGRQRTAEATYARELARASKVSQLGGCTLHLDSGIGCRIEEHGQVHQEAVRQFLDEIGIITLGASVTSEQIAQVFAGGFFEQVSALLKLTGSVESRRAQVHAWMLARVATIAGAYLTIFKRECDLEGYGSRLRLFVEHGWTDAQLLRELQAAYDRGDR